MGNIKNTKSSDALRARAWKESSAVILVCLLSGCALFPPPPAQCSGQFKPINTPVENNATLNKSPADTSVTDKPGELDKTLHSDEGAIDGK
jgi:hypothetical protein